MGPQFDITRLLPMAHQFTSIFKTITGGRETCKVKMNIVISDYHTQNIRDSRNTACGGWMQ